MLDLTTVSLTSFVKTQNVAAPFSHDRLAVLYRLQGFHPDMSWLEDHPAMSCERDFQGPCQIFCAALRPVTVARLMPALLC